MNKLTKLIKNLDTFQRHHSFVGFFYAIIKKYSQDNCGYQAAVLTYYGFLSLFPLLVVLTSLTKLLLKSNSTLRDRITTSTARYLPIVGGQLQHSIHSPKETGVALIISLLITLYGARGVASTLQYSLSYLWYVPQFKQPPFLKNVLRSFGIIIVGGLGLVIAAIASGYTAVPGNTLSIKILSSLVSLLLLWLTFIFIFKLAIAGNKRIKEVVVGAAIAAISLQILQIIGGLIMVHELKGLSSVYGTFALVIGLLFWIYLQAEVILYAVEVDVIKALHLFPRSLRGSLTDADKAAYRRLAEYNSQKVGEKVVITFQ